MSSSGVNEPLLGTGSAAGPSPLAPIATQGPVSPRRTEDELFQKKMKRAGAAAQKKAEGYVQQMKEVAKIATTPVSTATGASDVRVNVTTDSHSLSRLETTRTLQIKQDEERAKRNLWRGIVAQVLLSVVCVAVAAFLFFDTKLGDKWMLFGFPVDRWLICVALVPPIYAGAALLGNLILLLIEAIFDHIQHMHYVVLGLTGPLARFLTSLAMCGVVALLDMPFDNYAGNGTKRKNLLGQIVLCLAIYSTVSLFTKIGCRLLSIRVMGKSLFEKLKRTVEKEQILSDLMPPAAIGEYPPSAPRTLQIAKMRDIPPATVEGYLRDLYRMSLSPPYKAHESFTEQLIRLTASFQSMTEDELDQYAHHAAEFFWLTVRSDAAAAKLVRKDFRDSLEDEEDTDFAYELFDLDGDGFVVEAEVHERFEDIYRHRRHIANTLRDTNNVIVTLESLVGGVLHVMAFFAYLAIFNVDVGHLVLSFSSVAVAFAFVFGNSLREVYESVVFLFGVNPYDAGDCLWYNGTFATVDKFGLLNTQLVLTNGSRVWVPNQKLMNSGVTNLSESKPVAVYLELEVDASVPPAAVKELSKRMQDTAAANEELFDQSFDVKAHIQNVVSPLKYQVELCYKTTATMTKYDEYCQARAAMNETIGAWIQDYAITFSAPFQKGFAASK